MKWFKQEELMNELIEYFKTKPEASYEYGYYDEVLCTVEWPPNKLIIPGLKEILERHLAKGN